MNLVRISAAEAILEPFFDGGESYPDHQKYACFSQYRVDTQPGARVDVKQDWASVSMVIYSAAGDTPAVTMERSCDLDAGDFDTFILSAGSHNTQVQLVLRTDLGEEIAIPRQKIARQEASGGFRGKRILGIRLEVFLADAGSPGNCSLRWFGLGDTRRMELTQQQDYRFSPDWAGCLADSYEIGPEIGIWLDKADLPALREKLIRPPFDRIYANVRAEARSYLNLEPEKLIQEYLINENQFWTRDGHTFRCMLEYLPALCFVGMVEEDREMISLAARLLLSIAVTPHWCESFMGSCPGVTWHHRSFLEGLAVKRCALALDWIGSCLTWHGKNLVCDAVIQKGLPRVEADMFTVEYVRKTNQGVVFNNDRIFGYIALAKRYPRYTKMLAIAEADFFEMVEDCLEVDGGYREGPSYWNYNMDNMVESAHVLARYHGKALADYAPERMKLSGDYGLSMLCSRPEGLRWMLVNDSYGYGQYSVGVADFYHRLTGSPLWGGILRDQMQHSGNLETLLMVGSMPAGAEEKPAIPKGMLSLDASGETTLCRREENLDVLWHISAGTPYFSHFHEDKGQILLYVNGQELLTDRGNASAISKKPISHNLLVPESGGLPYSQPANAPGGKVLWSKYADGQFSYKADLTQAWEPGIFRRITRELSSHSPRHMLVTDCAQCAQLQPVSLRFHSVFPITEENGRFLVRGDTVTLAIAPKNYTPVSFAIAPDGSSVAGQPVYQLRLDLETARDYEILTELEILA